MLPQLQAPSLVPLHTPDEPLRLHDIDRNAWLECALQLRYPDYRDLDAWAEFRAVSRRLADQHLTDRIRQRLHGFFTPVGAPFMIVENLPVDPRLPRPPLDGRRPAAKQAVSEAVIAGLIGNRAEIFSYTNEKAGSPIQEIAPIPGMERSQSNAGRTPMQYHSDGAFLPSRFRPKGLLLYGLLNIDTATLLLPAEELADAASADLLDILSQPWYRHAQPASFSGATQSVPGPLLWRGPYGFARVAAASSSIEPLNFVAEAALRYFRELCSRLEPVRIVIKPGTALLFRNDRVLHGREAVTGARWLQRAYFTESLEPFRTATHADPCAFSFDAERLLQSSS